MKLSHVIVGIITLSLLSCKNEVEKVSKKIPERKEPKNISFTLVEAKEWFQKNEKNTQELEIAYAINRTDKNNLTKLDSIIIPADFSGDKIFYMPFPLQVSFLDKVDKIILFSYPTQSFATYENGILMHTGPTNMGREIDKTPTGLFFTNWKAEETISTFNDEWELKWNFNIENKLGVGFHEYELPGYPASHSCLRLLEKDAKYLYNWADQWVLADAETVKTNGTAVLIFGSYDFKAPKPWLQLLDDPKALKISEMEIEKIAKPHLNKILEEQRKRKSFNK